MDSTNYDDLCKQYENTVILESHGIFYLAFEEGAFVLAALLGYMVKRLKNGKYKAGFPKSGIEKVMEKCKQFHINMIVMENGEITYNETFPDNQFQTFCSRFDKTLIRESSPKKSNKLEDPENDFLPSSEKQFISFVQGQGFTLENAIMDVQQEIRKFLDAGKKIQSISLLENRSTTNKETVMVQGLVIYEQEKKGEII